MRSIRWTVAKIQRNFCIYQIPRDLTSLRFRQVIVQCRCLHAHKSEICSTKARCTVSEKCTLSFHFTCLSFFVISFLLHCYLFSSTCEAFFTSYHERIRPCGRLLTLSLCGVRKLISCCHLLTVLRTPLRYAVQWSDNTLIGFSRSLVTYSSQFPTVDNTNATDRLLEVWGQSHTISLFPWSCARLITSPWRHCM